MFGQSIGAIAALTFLQKTSFALTAPINVKIKKFAFEPKSLTIKRGVTVQWTNMDSAPHTATSTDHSWDTGGLGRNQTGLITFEQTGTFQYFCVYHPHMKGRIVVVD